MGLPAKKCRWLLEAGKVLERDSPPEPPGGMRFCQHLDFSYETHFWCLTTQLLNKILVFWSHQVRGNLLQQQEATSTLTLYLLPQPIFLNPWLKPRSTSQVLYSLTTESVHSPGAPSITPLLWQGIPAFSGHLQKLFWNRPWCPLTHIVPSHFYLLLWTNTWLSMTILCPPPQLNFKYSVDGAWVILFSCFTYSS